MATKEFGNRMADLQGKVRQGTEKDGVRLTGNQMFDAMTKAEQDELLGPDKAQLVRDGTVELSDLVQTNPQEHGADFITAKPLEDVDT